jgi:type I restriction enzyme R subunit
LIRELLDPKSIDAPGSDANSSHADEVLDALSQKLMRVLRKAENRAEKRNDIRAKLDELEQLWGVKPGKLHKHLHELGPGRAGEFIKTHHTLVEQLVEVNRLLGSERYPVISEHDDELLVREQAFGDNDRPGDYLDSFNAFIRDQLNQSAALKVVVTRPKDLTREQLKEVKLLLDQHGYSEANLKTAWRSQTNQEIAASIIGYIRQAALGEALIPFEQRVEAAMTSIYQLHDWTPLQRKWLQRLAKQLVREVVLEKQFINDLPAFQGGVKQLDKVLGSQLDSVLNELRAHLWEAV